MALVLSNQRTPSYKSWGQVNLSTNTDGVTGADVIDLGGLSLSGIDLSTAVSAACTYSFKGSVDSSSALHTILNSTGGVVMYGSTTVNPQGTLLTFDPAFWSGIRFLQLVSNTTGAAAANATGATAKIIGSAFGMVK